jgi:hypothetical protein
MTEEQPIIYRSGTSLGLGAGWDLMHVTQRNKVSFVLARDANRTVMRKIDSVPETWEVIRDEEMSRLARKCFDDRDKAREERSADEDDSEPGVSEVKPNAPAQLR